VGRAEELAALRLRYCINVHLAGQGIHLGGQRHEPAGLDQKPRTPQV
jgi:hypothetical protein